MLDLRISTVIRSIPVLILILFLSISTQAQYSGGTGEPNNPYQIAEPNDWVELMHTSKDWDECFILMGDIDVNGIYLMGIGTFTGIFDGNDCVIYNVVKYGSLFGAVGINGQVKNLVLENIQITGYENVGGLVERNYGTISNCFTTGTVSGAYDYFGGLVGINYGNITDSKSTCTVSGDWYIGGLVGNNEGNVTNCSSSGTVSGDDYYVGGLVGRNTGAVINCNSTSTVSGGKGCQYIGGLVGSNFDGGTISNCFSTGTVSGDIVKYYSSDYIGGLVGTNGGNITNCYSNASVTGNRHLGGLIGRNNGTITNCYSTGKVIGDYYIGGLVGDGEGYVLNCIWDTENSEQYESDGGIGLDTSDMMNPLTLGLNGFCKDPNWVLDTGNDYPRLAWQGTPGDVIPEPDMDWILGDGTPETPYEIDSAEKLILISKASLLWDRSFVLDDDIDLDPDVEGCKIFKSPVIRDFNGVFDGNGHIISNIVIEGGSYLGFFGQLNSEAEVRNIGIVDANVIGLDNVGCLVGYNNGDIVNCYSTGVVNGDEYIGGLLGYNYGNITNCNSNAIVNGDDYIGGLVGINDSTITDCNSTSTVRGGEDGDNIGGLVGINNNTITDCNSNGTVSGGEYSDNIGGLVGRNDSGAISNCFSAGKVSCGSGCNYVGGLVGNSNGNITHCFSSGTVSGGSPGGNFSIEGGKYTGGLIGSNDGNVTRCFSSSTVSGGKQGDYIGGLVGNNVGDGAISNCYSTGTVSGGSFGVYIGGLAGKNGAAITDCNSTGTVIGGKYGSCTGGLVGSNVNGGTISNCYNTGAVSGGGSSGDYIGGLAGNNGGAITDCYSTGTVGGDRYGSHTGGLVGSNVNGGTVSNCYSTGAVSAGSSSDYIGGLVGSNSGNITSCYSTGAVSTVALSVYIGGLVGNNGGTITDCNNSGIVTGYNTVGGLAGKNDGNVTRCYSTGAVNGGSSGDYIGGLVGNNGGTITDCNSSGTVTGYNTIGGLAGKNDGNVIRCYSTGAVNGGSSGDYIGGLVGSNGGKVNSCYSTGAVSGDDFVGGLVGRQYNEGTINYCYCIGKVIGDYYIGGLLGDGEGYVLNCIWDTETSEQYESDGGIGLDTSDMMNPLTLGLNGFCNDPNWVLDTGNDYPRLAWQGTPGDVIPEPDMDWILGDGKPETPYEIDSAEKLIMISKASVLWDRSFVLDDDVDLDPNVKGCKIFKSPVIRDFNGVFDGNGHIISNLVIEGGSYLGFFGQLNSGAEVRNIGIVDVNIISIGSDVGGLVGFNQGKVTNCYSRGKVNGYYGVGGFVGENLGTVTDCYNNSSVTGISDIGGLVGVNMGKVINSYSTGVVDGDDFIGGLIGSYSLGSVINSVWDMDTSGLSESNGGIGLTTNEMRDPYMLGLNGFANDPNWILDAGNDYPRLAWEGSAGEIIPKPSINWLEGSGIAEDPYLIDKAEQLILLGKASILCNAHFKLCTDINLDPKLLEIDIFEKALIPFFNGIFDGNGYTVSNIVIDGGYYLGLFSRLENSAEVRNLGIEDANVVSYEGHSGALAGLNLGIINNCNVTSTVSGSGSSDYIGGLVGSNYGIITNSNSTCVVSGNWYIGGLVGNNEGNVTNCYSTGIVSGNWYIGGLIGSNMFDNEVINCYSTGTVSGDHYNVGGLVGGNLGKVFRCYSTSTASGGETGDSIGGLIGSNMFGGEVSNCYSSGTVNGEYSIGGLVGENIEGRVSNCYSIGRVNGEDEVGGLIGLSSSANSTGCFWDTWTSGLSVSDGGLRRTTDEMKDINTYQVEGWDFFLEASDNDPNWIMSYNDYPHLAWEYPIWAEIPDLNGISFEEAVDIITGAGFLLADISPIYSETIIDNYVINQIPEIGSIGFIGFTKFNLSILCPDKFTAGSGSESDPYQISTLFDWLLLSNYPEYWAENFILINDINLMNLTITPIGSETVPFIGSFNGNGYSICNAVINRKDEDFVGLFGYLMNGQITGLRFKDSRVYGNDIVGGLVGFADSNSNFSSCSIEVTVSGNSIVGGLGGSNWGKVVQCYCNGTINGYSHVGGLVGYNNNTINDCNSNAIVTGNDYIGGLAGWNNGDIIKCYSTVDVNGFLEVGGLVGHNNGILNICYSSGKVNGEYGVGGLVGHNNGTLNICYSTGKVNGEYGVGGLVGVNYYDDFMQNKESGSIIKCYSNVNVYGLYSAGGLIGEHYGALVDNCYSSGTVNGNGYIGGLLGFYEDIGLLFEDLLNNSLWDIESSGVLNGIGNMNTDPIGVLGKTTAEMQTQITFTDAGWDFIGETINGPNDIWWILEGKDYPRLWWQLPVDDFNNCNAAPLWITDEMTPELVCLEETNSRLEVNSVGPLEYAEALYVSDGWWIDANESFALKVDFHFSQSGEGDGRISLGIRPGYADDMTQYAQLEAGSIDNDIYYLYTVTDEEFIDVNDWDRFLDDGVLYISYDPNFDELYFSNIGYGVDNAVYTVTGLVKDLWQCDSLSFYLGGGSQNMILTGEDAWLDNFAIDEGKIFQ